MAISLTNSAIKNLFLGVEVNEPVLQILSLRRVDNGRYRARLSDGEHFTSSALFSTQTNELIENEEIDLLSVIKLHRYMLNKVNETKLILIILEVSVMILGKDLGSTLGNPVPFDHLAAQSNGDVPMVQPPDPPKASNTLVKPQEKKPGIHPIAALTPYQNKWTICARVTSKSDIRTWSNSKGDGRLFSVNLLDNSGEIKATAFTDECDRLYSVFEENKLYYISGGNLKPANKKYTCLKNDYEITFHGGSTVSPCHDDSGIPKMQFEFVSIDQLEKMENNSLTDVIGICKSYADVSTIQQKTTGRELKKRDIQIVDDSNTEVRLTFWGSTAENFDGSSNPIVAVKGIRVSDFSGRSLSVLSSSVFQINPDIKEAHKLRAWYDSMGGCLSSKNLSGGSGPGSSAGMGSNFKTISEAMLENLGASGDAAYYSTKAFVNFIRQENCMYQACPGDGCNKKVVDLNNGMYRCEKCARDYDNFRWRLLLSASICDATDNTWVTMFQDQAEIVLGCTSEHLANLKENDTEEFLNVFQKASFREFMFKLRVKMDTYNDESRLKTTVVSISSLDPLEYTKFLMTDIQKMLK